MTKLYIPPKEIHIESVLNNREIDQNYVADLQLSMKDKGFLPEFPVDVFRTANLANIESALEYTCASGHHRTLAAQQAGLDSILCTLHDGDAEAFTEVMHLANFEFDPAQHSGIGQPFTGKEKRAAVKQLLLLPKYFEMTNAALRDAWRIPESNIRRWRGEVLALIEGNSPLLGIWGVSADRIERLRQLAETPERKDAEGKVVKIRKPVAEATLEEKRDFYEAIEKDAYRHIIAHFEVTWTHIQSYIQQQFKTELRYRQYEDVSMPQLQKLHKAILTQDPHFIETLQQIAEKERAITNTRETFKKATETCMRAFKRVLAPKMDAYSDPFRKLQKDFEKFVRENVKDCSTFHLEYVDYSLELRDDLAFCDKATRTHTAVTEALKSDSGWLAAFREKAKKANAKRWDKAKALWFSNLDTLRTAIAKYPRDISLDALCAAVENKYYWQFKHGEFRDLIETEAPSERKHLETVHSEAESFLKVTVGLNTDAEWVAAIPETHTGFVHPTTETEGVPTPESPMTDTFNAERCKAALDIVCEEIEKLEDIDTASEIEAVAEKLTTWIPDPFIDAFMDMEAAHVLNTHPIPLMFKAIQDRLIYIKEIHPLEEAEGYKTEIVKTLGEAARGMFGTEIGILTDIAIQLYRNNEETEDSSC